MYAFRMPTLPFCSHDQQSNLLMVNEGEQLPLLTKWPDRHLSFKHISLAYLWRIKMVEMITPVSVIAFKGHGSCLTGAPSSCQSVKADNGS